jgi:hypothetical protein
VPIVYRAERVFPRYFADDAYIFKNSLLSTKIVLTTIWNRSTMKLEEVNALGWVKA